MLCHHVGNIIDILFITISMSTQNGEKWLLVFILEVMEHALHVHEHGLYYFKISWRAYVRVLEKSEIVRKILEEFLG